MKDKAILVRVSDSEREKMKAAAERRGERLGKWIRGVLLAAAGGSNGIDGRKQVASEVPGLSDDVQSEGMAEGVPVVSHEEPEGGEPGKRWSCPLCNGKGWDLINFRKEECPRCKGTGVV